jgi:hypothetical protein
MILEVAYSYIIDFSDWTSTSIESISTNTGDLKNILWTLLKRRSTKKSNIEKT